MSYEQDILFGLLVQGHHGLPLSLEPPFSLFFLEYHSCLSCLAILANPITRAANMCFVVLVFTYNIV